MKSARIHPSCAIAIAGVLAACSSGTSNAPPKRPAQPMVTQQDLESKGGQTIEEVLQAKVPGIIVSRSTDGSIVIRIRGSTTFYGSNAPLYVVDDIPITPGPGGGLIGINPYDIESIKVLKDPADTGLYGMRGANGVISIKMKKPGPKKSGS